MLVKSFKTTLSIILAVTLCIPLSACQSKTQQTATSTTQEAYRWENFDDGSDELELDVSYIPENAEDFSFNVILEKGTFKNEVNAEHISLSGAIQGWQVESVQRKDDVTAAVSIKKPSEWSENGASLAQIEVSSSAIDVTATEQDVESIKKAQEEENNTETTSTNGEETQLSDEEILQIANEIESINTPDSYAVFSVFANPQLSLEQDSLNLDSNKLTLKMKASDLKLNGKIDKSNLRILDANNEESNIVVEDAKTSSSSEIEVTLNLPNSDVNEIDDLTLVLNGEANETQSDVKGSLKVQDPWMSVSMDNKDGTNSTFLATLNGTNDKLSKNDVKVSVDGEQIQDATVKLNDDGSCEITIPSTTAKDNSIVQVSAENVKDYAGQDASNIFGVSSVDSSEQSRLIDIAVEDLLLEAGKLALGELAKYGFSDLINVFTGEVSNDNLLDKINSIEGKLDQANQRVNDLYDLVQVGQYSGVVNDSRDLISKISGQEMILKGNMKEYNQAKTASGKQAALKKLYNDSANKTLLNDLAINLGVLYNKTMKADTASGKDLIQIYDDMCASTYNWASLAYNSRQNFRNEISSVWVLGYSQICAIYGAVANGAQDETLKVFEERNKNLNKLINTTHAIDESCCKKGLGSNTAYYNYTNAKWYSFSVGSDVYLDWSYTTTPFTESTTRKKYAKTAEVKAMTRRLAEGKTLEDELKELKVSYAKYLITSEKRTGSEFSNLLRRFHWLMDTFEVAKANKAGAGFTSNQKHLDAMYYPLRGTFEKMSETPASEMFVLTYES